jgi:hypothetical protein
MVPPLIMTVAGGVLLAVVTFILRFVPGGDFTALGLFNVLGLVGLGAAYVTRFGGRSVLPSR